MVKWFGVIDGTGNRPNGEVLPKKAEALGVSMPPHGVRPQTLIPLKNPAPPNAHGGLAAVTFKQEMHRRNGIEGTQSELVRGYGLRQARYRGEAKVRLQNYLIGAACNIRRLFRRVAWLTIQKKNALIASGAVVPS